MPLYDFKCDECTHIFERLCKYEDRDDMKCPTCGMSASPLISRSQPILFKEGWYEHIDKKPLYITSKKQLKDECTKRGLTSIYASEW